MEQHLCQCAVLAEGCPGPSCRGQCGLCDSSGKCHLTLGGSLVNVLGLGRGWEPLWYPWVMVMLLLEQLIVPKVWVTPVEGGVWGPPEVTNLVVFVMGTPGLVQPAVGVLCLCGVALQAFTSALSCHRLISSLGL